MTSSHSKTFVYVRPHENDKPAFTKTPLWRLFENPRFWYPKTPFTYGRKVERRKKSLFLKISGDVSTQPRPQGFSLKNGWGAAPPIFKGKSPGDEVGENRVCIFLFTRSHLLGPSQQECFPILCSLDSKPFRLFWNSYHCVMQRSCDVTRLLAQPVHGGGGKYQIYRLRGQTLAVETGTTRSDKHVREV